ncbi:MAG: aminopeptidase [Gammaproteobacteria bacterium]|nr:aminopeptidase [Gammaproteobacteria bacterium]
MIACSRCLTLLLVVLAIGGCSLGYYWQAATGHQRLMGQREPVDAVVADAATPAELAERLELTGEMLDFAHTRLGLPDNGSYRHYAEIDRDYVVWNVFAAPPLSLDARRWCYPVAGCVSYRGYFQEQAARDFAAGLAAQGDDVYVGGATAYSTLGRFKDPLLSTMLDLPDYRLAGLLFHELAHQRFYLPGDSSLNESFASAVEQAGLLLWLETRGHVESYCQYHDWLLRRADVNALLDKARVRLRELFASNLPEADKQVTKQEIFAALRADYLRLRESWGGPPYFDGWFGPQLNNAMLGALSTYESYVPAMHGLLAAEQGDFERFYERVEALAKLPATEREAMLVALPQATGPAGNCRPVTAALGKQPD